MKSQGDAPGFSVNPIRLLANAQKAVPAVAYATGVVGIAAAVTVIGLLGIDTLTMAASIVGMLFLMYLLLVFAALSKHDRLGDVAIVGAWSLYAVLASFALLLLSSIIFDKPLVLQSRVNAWLNLDVPTQSRDSLASISARDSGIPSTSTISRTEVVQPSDSRNPLPNPTGTTLEREPAPQGSRTFAIAGIPFTARVCDIVARTLGRKYNAADTGHIVRFVPSNGLQLTADSAFAEYIGGTIVVLFGEATIATDIAVAPVAGRRLPRAFVEATIAKQMRDSLLVNSERLENALAGLSIVTNRRAPL